MANFDPYLDLTELAGQIRRREISPVEVTASLLTRIHNLDPKLHAWALVLDDAAMAEARGAERAATAGEAVGPLYGVPVGIKDNCFTEGVVTTNGQPLHDGFVPAYDATVVARLRSAGAIILGKLSQTEGAFADYRSDIIPPVNPWNARYWPGTSSSGSGVATATGMCYASLGTDTGGSICYPSAMAGLTGVKPTGGRVSRHGIFENSASLDHVGPMARSARDAAAILAIIAGADPADPTASMTPVPNYVESFTDDLTGLRIGFDAKYSTSEVDADVAAVVSDALLVLSTAGARIEATEFPTWVAVVRDWSSLSSVEMAHAHRETYPSQKFRYGRALAEFIELGRAKSGLDYYEATKRRLEFRGRIARIFENIDILVVPAMTSASRTLEKMADFDADETRIHNLLRFTAPFNISGNPTVTLPGGFSADGTPIAFQLVGRPFEEDLLLRAAHAFQMRTNWHQRRPQFATSDLSRF